MSQLLLSLLFLKAYCKDFPGISSYVSIEVLENFKDAYIPVLLNETRSGQLRDVNWTTKFLFTTMNFEFYNIVVRNLSLDSNQVSVVLNDQTNEINLVISELYMNTSADFDLRWFGLSEGHTSVSLTNATITIPIEIGLDVNDPYIDIEALVGDLSNLKISFKSTNTFLNILGLTVYVWPITALDHLLLMHSFRYIFQGFNTIISNFTSSIDYKINVNNTDILFDASLVEFGVSTNTSIQAGVSGKFFKSHSLAPVPFMNESLAWETNKNFRVQFTDYFFNTLLWTLNDSGYLSIIVNSTTYPTLSSYLTTTRLQLIIPQLEAVYGPNLPINIDCSFSSYPKVNINTTIAVTGDATCTFIVNTLNGSSDAFTLVWEIQSQIISNVSSTVNGTYLSFKVDLPNTLFVNWNVTQTAVGPINIQNVESAINFAVTSVLNYIFPNLLLYKVKLPLPSFATLVNYTSAVYRRGLEVGGDLVFAF
jgi:LBP / BPI / CETP family, C-terminal domain